MGGDKENPDKGFTFRDRRKLFQEGETEPAADTPPLQDQAKGQTTEDQETDREADDPGEGHPLVPTFAGLLMSFASNGLAGLGLIPDPFTNKQEVDLVRAAQSIGILEMLQEKTRGNLTEDEGRMLEGLLYDLRMKFIEVKEGKKQ